MNSNLARPAFRHVVNCLLTVMEGIEWILRVEPQWLRYQRARKYLAYGSWVACVGYVITLLTGT